MARDAIASRAPCCILPVLFVMTLF